MAYSSASSPGRYCPGENQLPIFMVYIVVCYMQRLEVYLVLLGNHIFLFVDYIDVHSTVLQVGK